MLQSGITVTQFNSKNLQEGATYTFRVQARNAEGFGDLSDPV